MSTLHYSHGSSDNWTDLVTNLTSIEPLRFAVDLRQWLGWGTAPVDQLSVFMHEATHHWCFMSPVANALTALMLRARKRAIALVQSDRSDRERDVELEALLLDDLIRVQIGQMFLHPLAEGLAAFAEFDAISKVQSDAISHLMRWVSVLYVDPASSLFAAQQVPAEIALTADLMGIIAKLRQAESTLNRKASLLLSRFAADEGGYLEHVMN